ncbi:hypothetical protein HXX76_010071 [Chlamydomonas incerta]|uniref:Uncharacterized protein n=1 Tax=Chlamydomonas incerta TaxID=51695 RepID=A0A835SNT6_CHLIN|nr:hypothetical protein HXX76_010071 [Chlamydomonas incerta]|eukprot:KAG2430552.1 hypothetical protein HXX76_010071 [Chlamydomonas incerta]
MLNSGKLALTGAQCAFVRGREGGLCSCVSASIVDTPKESEPVNTDLPACDSEEATCALAESAEPEGDWVEVHHGSHSAKSRLTDVQAAEVAAVQTRLEATARKEESGAWERLAPYIAALPHAVQRARIPKPGAEAAAKAKAEKRAARKQKDRARVLVTRVRGGGHSGRRRYGAPPPQPAPKPTGPYATLRWPPPRVVAAALKAAPATQKSVAFVVHTPREYYCEPEAEPAASSSFEPYLLDMSEEFEEKLMKSARGAKRHAAAVGKTSAGASHHPGHGHKRGGRAGGGLVLRPIGEADGSFALRIAHPSEQRLQAARPSGFIPVGEARARRQLHRASAACRATCKADVPVAQLWPYL